MVSLKLRQLLKGLSASEACEMETSGLIASGSGISVTEEAGREVSYLLLKREADSKAAVRKLHTGRSAKQQAAEILSSPFLPQHHLEPARCMLWDTCPG